MARTGNVKKVTHDRRKQAVKHGNPAGALEADVKRLEAVRLRREGHTFKEIGIELGVSDKTAHVYVHDGWERIKAETDEERRELRDLELDRLNGQYKRLYPIATRNNLRVEKEVRTDGGFEIITEEDAELQIKASAECRKISELRIKLLGLFAPTKVEVTGKRKTIPLEELAAMVAAQKAAARN